MALLGRKPARREAEPEPALQVPRQRRADAHPDAPPRPPLLARDLGEPLDLDEIAPEPTEVFEDFEETGADKSGPRPLPGFLVPQEPDLEAEPIAEAERFDSEPPPAALTEPEPWIVPAAGPEPEARPEPESVPLADLAARLPGGEPEEETNDQSLAQLVNRIEFGVSRKRQALPAVDLPPAEPVAAETEKVGHRLRSAISDLQKIASSGA
jgi:hypothetical protein